MFVEVQSVSVFVKKHPTIHLTTIFFIWFLNFFIVCLSFGCIGSSLFCRRFPVAKSRGCALVAVQGLLIMVASLAVSQAPGRSGLSSRGSQGQYLWLAVSRAQTQELWHRGLIAPGHVGSSGAWDPTCVPLRRQADSLPLSRQGSLTTICLIIN